MVTPAAGSPTSLVKVLLRQPYLQPALLQLLLETLSGLEPDEEANDGGGGLSKLILGNIRWLDTVYDPAGLTETMLEIVR